MTQGHVKYPDALPLQSRTIALSEGEWSALDTAIPDIIETLDDVQNALWDMSYLKDLDQPGINATLRLIARAVRSMEDTEVRALERLDHVIRHANPKSLADRGGQP